LTRKRDILGLAGRAAHALDANRGGRVTTRSIKRSSECRSGSHAKCRHRAARCGQQSERSNKNGRGGVEPIGGRTRSLLAVARPQTKRRTEITRAGGERAGESSHKAVVSQIRGNRLVGAIKNPREWKGGLVFYFCIAFPSGRARGAATSRRRDGLKGSAQKSRQYLELKRGNETNIAENLDVAQEPLFGVWPPLGWLKWDQGESELLRAKGKGGGGKQRWGRGAPLFSFLKG